MSNRTSPLSARALGLPAARYVFYGLLVLLFVLAVGHLYALRGLTDLYLGLPAWIWIQLVVVAVMLGIAWIAVGIHRGVTEGADR